MFEVEQQVKMRRQQVMDEAERSRLAHTSSGSRLGLYTQMRNVLSNVAVRWNARFQKDVAQIVEACCAVVATPEAECIECGVAA
jgi:hypothetical protein